MNRIEPVKTKKDSVNSNNSSLIHNTPLLQKRRYTSTKINITKELNSDSFFWRPNTAAHDRDKENHNQDINSRVYLNGPGPGKYGRATSIGHLNHDVTLKTEPAYTMCKAERFVDRHELHLSRDFTCSSAYWGRPSTGESNMTRCTSAYFSGPGPASYCRASSIGHFNTDVTLTRPPAYSIGKAERIIDLNANPHLARPKTPRATPGPLDYCYEKHSNPYKSSVPAYSIGRAPRFPTIIV